ncbi:DUF4913 domain-containing protein [Streptomyces qinglanensis]|uniref:DUF4913 domain-containing protein n=1 Tax=Streptomyces qinglanensis TaxID=943816 RepID=UPI003D7070AE
MPDSFPAAPGAGGVPRELLEDVEDLKAQVRALTSQLQVRQAPPTQESTAPGADQDEQDGPAGEEEGWQYPPFLFLLDGPQYNDELRALIEWVESVLVPAYLAEPSADARWCHLWFEHPVALARLHALWLAWQELTDPATCGYTGPSTWHRDHYDPCMRELRASTGPFQGCTKGEHRIEHRLPGPVPSAWSQEE